MRRGLLNCGWPAPSWWRAGGEPVYEGGDGVVATMEPTERFGEGTSAVLKEPYFSSVRWSTAAASSGRSTPHLRASTLMMLSVRRAQSQSSAISSRCLMPWMTSRLAVFSGRFSMWMVTAEWIM